MTRPPACVPTWTLPSSGTSSQPATARRRSSGLNRSIAGRTTSAIPTAKACWWCGRRAVAPQAFASIYPWAGNLVHELETISRTPFTMSRDGAVAWRPVSGLTFRPIPGAPVPDAKPVARLREMKELADRFEVTMLGWNADDSDRERLRRLPKEFFRHKPESPEVLDGAVFGFVKGTDPEAVLVIEVVPGADASAAARYEFAFARATSGGLEARLGDDVVWTATKTPVKTRPVRTLLFHRTPLGE